MLFSAQLAAFAQGPARLLLGPGEQSRAVADVRILLCNRGW